jgi:hypothetical protein
MANLTSFCSEWMYLQHSVLYDRLPDYFLAFDMCAPLAHPALLVALMLSTCTIVRRRCLCRGRAWRAAWSYQQRRARVAQNRQSGRFLSLQFMTLFLTRCLPRV